MRREKVILLISAGVGLLAAWLMYMAMQRQSHPLVPVLVASRNLDARSVLDQSRDVTTVMLPPEAQHAGTILTPADLQGKMLLSPVYAGEQIRKERVGVSDHELGPDEMAIAFPTDLVAGVGNLLNEGDLVDVYLMPVSRPGVRATSAVVQRIGEAFRVYKVRDASGRDITSKSTATAVPVLVVLKVASDDVALQLRQAGACGLLSFVKRSPNGVVIPARLLGLPPGCQSAEGGAVR